MKQETILYRPHDGKECTEPKQGTEHAAGWDLYCAEDTKLEAYKATIVPTYFDVAVPDMHALLVMPRSGIALKRQIIIPNSPGLIDADYRGHLCGLFTWIPHPADLVIGRTSQTAYEQFTTVKQGERIAQLVLIEYIYQIWKKVGELPPTARGKGGFGSTGS